MSEAALSDALGVTVERAQEPRLVPPSDGETEDPLAAAGKQSDMLAIAAAAGTFGLGLVVVLVADKCKYRWKKYLKRKGDTSGTGPRFERQLGGSVEMTSNPFLQ